MSSERDRYNRTGVSDTPGGGSGGTSDNRPIAARAGWVQFGAGGRLSRQQAERIAVEQVSVAGPSSHGCEKNGDAVDLSTGMDSLPVLAKAFDECATEDKRISAEIRALQSFMKEIGDLQAVDVGPAGGRPSDSADGAELSDVMDSYRATVTDVDHYQEDYGEPAGVHMAKDFGKGIAKLIYNGGVLSESLKQELLKQAKCSISVREEALAGLDVEQDALETFRGLLEQVDRQRGNICEHLLSHDDPDAEVLIDISTRVDRLESRLEQITDDRIEMLWDPPAFDGEVPASSLCEYRKGETGRVPHFYDDLYRRIEAIDPVLASAATIANRCARIQEATVCLLGEIESEYSPYSLGGR